MKSPRVRRDGYTEVGPACAPFDCQIDLEDAETLRDVVAWDFFYHMNAKTRLLSDIEDKTVCAKSFHPELGQMAVTETPSVFAGAILHRRGLDDWRMVVMQSKSRQARWNNARQHIETRLNVEVFNGELVEAVRKVRVVRGVGELTVAAIENQMEEDSEAGFVVMQRRAFERQMTKEDCQAASEFLQRTVRRSKVMAKAS